MRAPAHQSSVRCTIWLPLAGRSRCARPARGAPQHAESELGPSQPVRLRRQPPASASPSPSRQRCRATADPRRACRGHQPWPARPGRPSQSPQGGPVWVTRSPGSDLAESAGKASARPSTVAYRPGHQRGDGGRPRLLQLSWGGRCDRCRLPSLRHRVQRGYSSKWQLPERFLPAAARCLGPSPAGSLPGGRADFAK